MSAPEGFVDRLRRNGIRDERVLAAMGRVRRELFVPEELRDYAYDDSALPIGHEATISQPTLVARMCEELALRGHERVLDVGSGSGYAAAVLAERARSALATAGYDGVEIRVGDGSLGVPERAPFDAIVVGAAAPAPPPALYAQLAGGGRLVVPVGGRRQHLAVVTRGSEGPVIRQSVPVRFVPLVGEEGFQEPGR